MISISEDKHGKVFDVVNFDMINILAFDFTPEVSAWIHQPGDAIQVQFFFFHKPMISKRLGIRRELNIICRFSTRIRTSVARKKVYTYAAKPFETESKKLQIQRFVILKDPNLTTSETGPT